MDHRPIKVMRLVSSLTQGGVGKVCFQTVSAMNPALVETTIVVFGEKPKHVEKPVWPASMRVLACPLNLAPRDLRVFQDPSKLCSFIEREQPDIIHLHEPQFVLAVRAAMARAERRGTRTRLVVHLHNDYRRRNDSMPKEVLSAVKQALRQSELIACSETIEQAGLEWLDLPKGRIIRIEDGADDATPTQTDTALANALDEAAGERRVIACMANLAPHKRIEDFIEACARLAQEGLPVFGLLMGYGKKEAADSVRRFFDQRIAPECGEFLYRVGQPHSLFERIDVGVSPSSLEGLGLNILEYQSQGIPVVCTDLPPHREMVVDGESGLLFPVGDVESLTAILRNLIEDEKRRQELGEAGRRSSARRRWRDTAASTERFYKDLTSGSP